MLKTLVFREYRYKDDIDEKIKELEKKEYENDIEKLEQLAEIYHAYKNNEKAINIYHKICILKPDNYEILAYLGYLYYEEGKLIEAEKYLTRSLELEPLEPFVLFLLGNVLSRRGNIIEAINYYELSIFLDFDVFTAHIDFGRKYEHMGRHKRALEEYMAAYKLDKNDNGLLEKIDYLKEKIGEK